MATRSSGCGCRGEGWTRQNDASYVQVSWSVGCGPERTSEQLVQPANRTMDAVAQVHLSRSGCSGQSRNCSPAGFSHFRQVQRPVGAGPGWSWKQHVWSGHRWLVPASTMHLPRSACSSACRSGRANGLFRTLPVCGRIPLNSRRKGHVRRHRHLERIAFV